MEVDLILADIITNELEINPSRVVVYSQNYEPPKDSGLYVIISTTLSRTLGTSNQFDKDTNEEIKSVSSFVNMTVEITSKNRDALTRKEEVLLALVSNYSLQKQEENNIKLFRNLEILDLTFIEGSSSLYRFQIPVTCTRLLTKRKVVDYFDKQRENEINIQGVKQ